MFIVLIMRDDLTGCVDALRAMMRSEGSSWIPPGHEAVFLTHLDRRVLHMHEAVLFMYIFMDLLVFTWSSHWWH